MDAALLEFCATPRQREVVQAVIDYGGNRPAARALGLHSSSVDDAVNRAKKAAALQGWAPEYDMTRPAPPGFNVKGTSTLYNSKGEQVAQWVKTAADAEERDALMREAVKALCEDIRPVPPLEKPEGCAADLCNKFVITDYHMGMLAWHREGGDNWNLKIARETLETCFRALMAGAPKANTCVIAQLGDFLHTDTLIPTTPTSGHVLDADGRFEKIADVAVDALHRVIDLALSQHEQVHVIMAEGNHDIASSVWLRAIFDRLYANEPRVTVDRSPLPYYAHKFGRTMLGFHHGHLKKPERLVGVFAAQFPEMWGQTKYRYGDIGHEHHKMVLAEKEDAGMTIERHRTLAARDAHASRGGYYAERKIKCTTYHAEYGEVGANYVTPEMAL